MAIKNFLKLALTVLASSAAVAVALPQILGDNKPGSITVILTNQAGRGEPRLRQYDPTLPVPEHTCTRDFLVALANFSEFCEWDEQSQTYGCGGDKDPPSMPTLQDCCEYWIETKDVEEYKNCTFSDFRRRRSFVIATKPDAFRTSAEACGAWRHQTEMQYIYYMLNLANYGLQDMPPVSECKMGREGTAVLA